MNMVNAASREDRGESTNGVFGSKCPIEIYRRTLPLAIFPFLVIVFPSERNIGSWRDAKRCGHDGIGFLHELLLFRTKSRQYLFG